MKRLRIYGDFHRIFFSPRNPERKAVSLDSYGSLRDLSNAGVRLKEGMELVVFDWSDENEDIEVHCKVYYDWQREFWLAEFDEQGIVDVPKGERKMETEFLCLDCRSNLEEYFSKHGRNAETKCPTCGTLITAAIAPPENQTSE